MQLWKTRPYQIELYVETMQGILFSDPASQREVRQGYIRKYRDRRPDVVIAVGPARLSSWPSHATNLARILRSFFVRAAKTN